jgi:hypothetical protein
MENKENIQQETPAKKRWYPPYIVAGLIIGAGTTFAKTAIGAELILIGTAIGAGFLYYPLKSKIKIKNEIVRIIIVFFILEIISGLLTGVSIGLINKFSSNTGYQQKIASCQNLCNFIPTTKVWNYPFHTSTSGDFIPSKFFQTQEQCLNYCLTQ